LDATSCLSLRLTCAGLRDLVESWRPTFKPSGHSSKIYSAKECPVCGDWACTLQEVGKQVTWTCEDAEPGSQVCTRTFCCHGCECANACCCPGKEVCLCDCHKDICVLLTNPIGTVSAAAKFSLVKFKAWPDVLEVEEQLVTRDVVQCRRAVQAFVDPGTKRIRAPEDKEEQEVLCHVPLEPGHVILQVCENEAFHTYSGLILCHARNEAARLAAKWVLAYPDPDGVFTDAHATSLAVREALTTGVSVSVNTATFELSFKIIN
jgi:hypothetical protein